ncbi:hypothetical protein GCM10023235_47040 [Kitasatospora terrestris]|uniref:Uncharacterized protein n=1 Tax=Kitasatospora terrestris TaxID=258051 RepID=A0ABP9E561_9ACTN
MLTCHDLRRCRFYRDRRAGPLVSRLTVACRPTWHDCGTVDAQLEGDSTSRPLTSALADPGQEWAPCRFPARYQLVGHEEGTAL